MDIKGKSTSVLKVLAENVKDRLSDIEGIEDIDTSLERGEEEIQVRVHREKASRYGLSPDAGCKDYLRGFRDKGRDYI